MLVKTVTIDSLVEKLKVNSFTSTETVLAKSMSLKSGLTSCLTAAQ